MAQALHGALTEQHIIVSDNAERGFREYSELAEKAAAIYAGRREREQVFEGFAIFAEPAWDILLDLFVAAAQGKRISISSCAVAAAVAPTTALRWISTLVDHNLAERVSDPYDRRRAFLRLTEQGFDLVAKAVAVAG